MFISREHLISFIVYANITVMPFKPNVPQLLLIILILLIINPISKQQCKRHSKVQKTIMYIHIPLSLVGV